MFSRTRAGCHSILGRIMAGLRTRGQAGCLEYKLSSGLSGRFAAMSC